VPLSRATEDGQETVVKLLVESEVDESTKVEKYVVCIEACGCCFNPVTVRLKR